MTALHYAGRAGCLRMMKLLVDAGACTMALDKDKKSPVQFAAAYSHPVSLGARLTCEVR